jgi:hypothetical protein
MVIYRRQAKQIPSADAFPRKQSPSFLIRSARTGECPSASAQPGLPCVIASDGVRSAAKGGRPAPSAPATPAARFLRAPASRGCFVFRIATHSFPCDAGTLVPSDAGTAGPCGTPAFWDNKDPKAATRAKRRSNPAPTSVLQGGNLLPRSCRVAMMRPGKYRESDLR